MDARKNLSACAFCEIAADETRASIVYADATTLAFLDTHPLFLGHTLVVPRQHTITLDALAAADVGPFFLTVQRIARAVEVAMDAAGTFVAINNRVSQS